MKPIIKSIYESITGSIFQTSSDSTKLENDILKIFYRKQFSTILNSNIQLYLTLFVSSSSNCNNCGVLIDVTSELEGDHDIYALQCALSNVKLPEGINGCRILISTTEYQNQVISKNEEISNAKFIAVDPKWNFDSIILTDDVKKRLMRAIAIIEYKDVIFDTLEFSKVDKSTKSIICLYGPAGTGKTITAQAIAKYLNKKIIISSYAQIESKYVGDGAKNLRAIFKSAEEQAAVLFMDEADSFLSKRIESTESSSDKHYNRMSNELFQLLEDFNGCVIFATNLMTDVDKAFKSRIIDSIMMPLPDENGRVEILKQMVPARYLYKIFPTQMEIVKFSKELNGFSGRDIRKSLLLSYALIAPKLREVGVDNYTWSLKDFRNGFDDVRETVEIIEDIPLEEAQEFTEKLKRNRKQFELAKHALCVDGNSIDERERTVISELSQALLNRPFSDDVIIPTIPLLEICENASVDFKESLIDTAVRVITIDGDFSEAERQFISKLCKLLEFSDMKSQALLEYTKSMANTYKYWIEACQFSKKELF